MNRTRYILLSLVAAIGVAAVIPTAFADGSIDCSKLQKWDSLRAPFTKGTIVYTDNYEFKCKLDKCGSDNPIFYPNVWERVGECKAGTAPK